MPDQINVLYIDEEEAHRQVLGSVLIASGFNVSTVDRMEDALSALLDQDFTICVCHFLGGTDRAKHFLNLVIEKAISTPISLLFDQCSVDSAVTFMRDGAADVFIKPVDSDDVTERLKSIVTRRRSSRRGAVRSGMRFKSQFLSLNQEMNSLLEALDRVASVNSSVLLTGESGTGKELLARRLHERSNRSGAPFVAINCGAIPPQLLESELFGHEAGAFTGADEARVGIFEFASLGTIFLDEIGDMPYALQVKLLRTLQEEEIKRVGGTRVISVSPRIVSATNHSIKEAITNGTLREDLFYRLGVIEFTIPPLRERPEDIPFLASHYLKLFCQDFGRATPKVSDDAWLVLKNYSWPGNARELENVMERAAVLADDVVLPIHLGLPIGLAFSLITEATNSLTEIAHAAARRAEISVLLQTLEGSGWNKSQAARTLGVSYKTLLAKVKEHRLSPPQS